MLCVHNMHTELLMKLATVRFVSDYEKINIYHYIYRNQALSDYNTTYNVW